MCSRADGETVNHVVSEFPKLAQIIENDSCKTLWDFTVLKDHVITKKRLDMIFIDKEHHEC